MGQAIEEGSLTGQRRFVRTPWENKLVLQVEVNTWRGNPSGSVLGRWSTKWRYAKPSDITSAETVIGLNDISYS
jgi:hypothetical protein